MATSTSTIEQIQSKSATEIAKTAASTDTKKYSCIGTVGNRYSEKRLSERGEEKEKESEREEREEREEMRKRRE